MTAISPVFLVEEALLTYFNTLHMETLEVPIRKDRVYIVGLGPGDVSLITLKALSILKNVEIALYTGSLLSPKLVRLIKDCAKEVYNTSNMSEDEIVNILESGYRRGKVVAWFHDGCPTIYGGLWGVIRKLRERNIPYEIVPGVPSFCAAAARLGIELTVPEESQTLVISRISKRTPMREEECIRNFVGRGTIVLMLSIHAPELVIEELKSGGMRDDDQILIIHRVTWGEPVEKIIRCRLGELVDVVNRENIKGCAVIIVGPCIRDETFSKTYRSIVYSPDKHKYSKAILSEGH